ncbi:MAG TPA: allantoicase [Acidimicrobiia bacterium]|nr:allantoicase [Acidimicrobiia bacterium]
MIDLISERVGGRIVAFNDEFFAAAVNLIQVEPPVAKEEYTDRGKWMDGWETRRRREPGHDWVVVRLGIPGRIRKVSVDTSYFTGNFPEQFSLDVTGVDDLDRAEWLEVIPRTDLAGSTVAEFDVEDPHRVEMVRLNIYPDGGVARLRVEGEPIPAMSLVCPEDEIDLALSTVGGEVVDASDLHYSHPANMLWPTESVGMWDGWETRRRRESGHDWVVVRLGMRGRVDHLIIDTTHFKGNAPGWVSAELSDDGRSWTEVVSRVPVDPHKQNVVGAGGAVGEYLRLSIHPDGGIARLRVFGNPDPAAAGAVRVRYLNALFGQAAARFFHAACASTTWVDEMIARRPFATADAVLDVADDVFDSLEERGWLEAFAGHPRIGERGDDENANREQVGTSTASRETIRDLIDVNRRYEDKFGFTYIVYATGRTAEEMLAIARDRLENDRHTEIANASGEQRRITATRLRRMLCQEVS